MVGGALPAHRRADRAWPSPTPIFAFTARQEGDNGFNILFRWVVTPLMLFSGTFFPIEPAARVDAADRLGHPAVARRRGLPRRWPTGARSTGALLGLHLLVLVAFVAVGWWLADRSFTKRLVP